jgi:hypothetical protein
MRHTIGYFLLALLLPSAALIAQATRPANSREALQVAREAEKSGILKQLSDYPMLPPVKLSDVVILGLRGGHLTMQTRLAPTTMPSRLEISDLPGISTLTLRLMENTPVGSKPYEPAFFLLEHYQFDKPNSTVSCITVEALPTSVQLAWSSESLTGMSEVTMVEQVGPTGPAGNLQPANIELRVSNPPAEGDAGETQIELKAPDFQTLRREHPAEVEKYLGPIIRELHADAVVLPPDTVLAWQVFSSEAHLKPEFIDAVQRLVKQLDSDDFSQRESARQSLVKRGPELSRLDRSKLSPEQISTIDGFVRQFQPVSPDLAKRLSNDPAFLLSCLTDSDDFISHTAFAHLQTVSRTHLNFDFATQGQHRRDAVEKLRQQLEPSDVQHP